MCWLLWRGDRLMRKLRNWMHQQRQHFQIETTPEEVQLDAVLAVLIALAGAAMLFSMLP